MDYSRQFVSRESLVRSEPSFLQEIRLQQQAQEIQLLKFALQNEARYHDVMQQEIKILEQQTTHDLVSTARTRRVPRIKRPEPVSRLRAPLVSTSKDNLLLPVPHSEHEALKETKSIKACDSKKHDFTVSPLKASIRTTRSGLKAQDKRIDLEDAQGLARADQRLIKSFEKVLLEKEAAAKTPRGRKKRIQVFKTLEISKN